MKKSMQFQTKEELIKYLEISEYNEISPLSEFIINVVDKNNVDITTDGEPLRFVEIKGWMVSALKDKNGKYTFYAR